MQGRMKYVRPLFRALNKMDSSLAKKWFEELKAGYHPIAAGLVGKDLGVEGR